MIPAEGYELKWQGVVALAVIAAALVLTLIYVEDGQTVVLAVIAAVASLLPGPTQRTRIR